jgi:hypothetical protein
MKSKKGPVNNKDIQIMMYYQYMNWHLQLLFEAKTEKEKDFQISKLKEVRDILLKLGYFGKVVA